VTGFRDPYVFKSPVLSKLLDSSNSTAKGEHFATISGGIIDVGPKLWLYRQKEDGNVIDWEYVGPFIGDNGEGGIGGVNKSWSDWSGSESFRPQSRASFYTRMILSLAPLKTSERTLRRRS
jgi:beta-fructofuranosidase